MHRQPDKPAHYGMLKASLQVSWRYESFRMKTDVKQLYLTRCHMKKLKKGETRTNHDLGMTSNEAITDKGQD